MLLAQALAGGPAILLLDEPTSALDPRNALELMALVRREARQRERSIVIAIHDLNAAARCADRIVVLRNGRKLADGPPPQVLTAPLLADAYGIEVEIHIDRFGCPVVTAIGIAGAR